MEDSSLRTRNESKIQDFYIKSIPQKPIFYGSYTALRIPLIVLS